MITKEESIERVDSLIFRLITLVEDLREIKKEFIDFDDEYFSHLKIKNPDEVEILGFIKCGPCSNGDEGFTTLFWKRYDIYSKYFYVKEEEIKNINRTKLLDKIIEENEYNNTKNFAN